MNKTIVGAILGYFSAGELNKSKLLGTIVGGLGGKVYEDTINYLENKTQSLNTNIDGNSNSLMTLSQGYPSTQNYQLETPYITIEIPKEHLPKGYPLQMGVMGYAPIQKIKIYTYPNESSQHAVMRFETELKQKYDFKNQLEMALQIKISIHHGTWKMVASWESYLLELRKLRHFFEEYSWRKAKDSGSPHYLTFDEVTSKISKLEFEIDTVKQEFRNTFGFELYVDIQYKDLFYQISKL